jgi:hypothetical protein
MHLLPVISPQAARDLEEILYLASQALHLTHQLGAAGDEDVV